MTESSQPEESTRDVIAVVGMAGRFPGAGTVSQFWNNLRAGVEAIREFSIAELQASGVPLEVIDDPTYVNVGAPVEDADCFDAAFFGYTPREAELMDPQQRLFLQCAYAALEDAGYDPAHIDMPVGVFGGVARNTYFIRNAEVYRSLMDQGALHEMLLSSEKDFTATRVSFKLNLKGPGIDVQTACSTSGVAVHLACQSLMAGDCDMALAGGARVRVPQHAGYHYVEGGIPSPDGHCRAFDAGANGCVFGSGVALLTLKRLPDAIADGDQVHALILATAINNDGSAKVGFTAPSVEGQSRVIQEALALADVDAATIGYVETHGTGTTLGDPIEIAALTNAFRQSSQQRNQCAIGSVKTNIGHLDAGAGAAGMIKTILSLKHKQIPASLNFTRPNPQIDFANSPFFVNDKLRDWDANATPRRAGISSFGLGGTNFHAILEEAPQLESSAAAQQWQVLPLSAKSVGALETATRNLTEHLKHEPGENLADAAYTLAIGRQTFEHRRIAVGRDVDDVVHVLEGGDSPRLLTGKAKAAPSSVVYMFSGQGSQHVAMGRDLYESERVFRRCMDECADILRPHLGLDLREILYPKQQNLEAATEQLDQTAITQPALFAVEYSLARLWMQWGIEPAAMIGHSVGEYVAACLAGVFSLEDALRLVAERARLMQQQQPGTMLAVRASEDDIREFLGDGIELAACNAPSSCVLSGKTAQIEDLAGKLAARNIDTRVLRTSHAFHSAMMEPALEPFTAAVQSVTRKTPSTPFISSVTGTWITDEQATDPAYWATQMRQPVLFSQGMRELQETPGRIFLEVGPGRALCTLALQHPDKQAAQTVVASLGHPQEHRSDRESMLLALGKQWVAGQEIQWSKIYGDQQRRRVSLPTYPFERQRHWLKPVASTLGVANSSAGACTPDAPCASDTSVLSGPAQEAQRTTEAQPATRKESVCIKLKQILHELSGVELDAIDENAVFLEMGFDSLFLTRANVAFQKEFNVRITFRQLFEDAPTLTALAGFIDSELPDQQSIGQSAVATTQQASKAEANASRDSESSSASGSTASQGHGPWKPIKKDRELTLNPRQRQHLDDLIERYTAKTRKSKEWTESQRKHLADPRAVTSFHRLWKEMVYQIAVEKSSGARFWDLDGNEYVDLVMGFGVNMFGFTPDFVRLAIEQQLADGMALGVLAPKARELADLLCKITGLERVNFVNTGSEAISAAVRAARTTTGRDRIAVFAGDYHGIADELLVQGVTVGGQSRSVPVAPGIPDFLVENVLVLDYEDPGMLEKIREHAHELAGVLVEPGPASRPSFPQREAIHALRHVCTECDVALILDELITGLRLNQRGAQGYFDVDADLVSYGKVLSGGMPLAAVGGKARFMDAFDGGKWQFGDDSFPEGAVTFFGGTFVRHPLSLAASLATLKEIEKRGPQLQEELNRKTAGLVRRIDQVIQQTGVPLSIENCGSMLRLKVTDENPLSRLIFFHLREKGVHMTERIGFLSSEHSDADVDFIVETFERSVREMLRGECFQLSGKTSPARLPQPITPTQYRGAPGPDPQLDGIPLTDPQQELWLSAGMSREQNAAYNLPMAIDLRGELDVRAMRDSLQQLVDRHDALRTTIGEDGERQFVASQLTIETPLIDLQELTIERRTQRLAEICTGEVEQVFDLARGPLVRTKIVRLGAEHHKVFISVHHIICDGYSCGVLCHDLCALYSANRDGRPAQLTAPPQLTDFALSQRDDEHREARAAAESYWLGQFSDMVPTLDLPTDHVRPPVKTFNADRVAMLLERVSDDSLKQLSSQSNCTVFAITFAAYTVFLHRLSRQNNVVVGIAAAAQAMTGQNDLVGHCVNLLPVHARLDGQQSFADYLKEMRGWVLKGLEHQNYTFGSLIQKLKVERDPSRIPLVSVIFNMDVSLNNLSFADLETETEFLPRKYENFDLFFNFRQHGGVIHAECTYNTDLFEGESMRRHLQEFETLFAGIVADPNQLLSELPLIPESERRTLTRDWNQTQRDYPSESCIHRLVEEQVRRTPDKVAVVCEGRTLTYAELDREANALAHRLAEKGVGPDVMVGICLHRKMEMLVGILGILKAGGAYVPIDPSYPKDRIQFMLDDSQSRVLVTEMSLLDALAVGASDVIVLDEINDPATDRETPAVTTNTDPDHLAYVIYTSGSTGKPKGVQISHRALVNFLNSMQREPGMTSDDVMFAVTTLSFDIAGLELFLPLISGGCVEIASGEVAADVMKLMDALEHSDATIMQATPATWRMLIEAGWRGKQDLKVLCGGEAMPRDMIVPLIARCAELWNMYGPTETTVWSSVKRIDSADGVVTIGRPIDNTKMYILDESLNLVPTGVPGELHIGGDGLARGYLERPELTEERFIPDPYGEDGERIYKTGDLARFLADGQIECLGRIDGQVKIRGFRIELGEIESVLSAHRGVQKAVAVAREDTPGDQRLVAYFTVSEQENLPPAAELRTFVRAKLPDYMVPQNFVPLSSIPLTPNGKVDRRSLPDPFAAQASASGDAESLVAGVPSDSSVGADARQPDASPRDALEMQLCSTWEALLHVKPVGIHDDFFDLGGHSLLAARLMGQIEKIYGQRLPLATFLQTRTVAGLAEILRSSDWKPNWDCLVPIRAGGSKPPLFLIHAAGGNVLIYQDLARHLGEEQPVYGLQSHGLDGKQELHASVEEMATAYRQEIQKMQASGPYLLGGYCLGGTIALEVATQLTEQGEQVAFLGMLDAHNWANMKRASALDRGLHSVQKIDFHLRNLWRLPSREKLLFFRGKLSELRRRGAVWNDALKPKSQETSDDSQDNRSLSDLWANNDRAADEYVPRYYAGHMTHICPVQNYSTLSNADVGWGNIAQGGVDVITLPVYPAGMLIEPYVNRLASEMVKAIEQGLAHGNVPAVATEYRQDPTPLLESVN